MMQTQNTLVIIENWIGQHWLLEALVQPIEFSRRWSSAVSVNKWWDSARPPLRQWCVSVQMLHSVLTFSSKEEVGRIWKMELLKESDGLGIQVSGGRGSKRSPHAIVVTQVKEGGAAHRWLDNTPLSLLPCPPLPCPRVPGGSQRPGDYSLQGRCWSMAGNQARAVLIKYPSEHRKWLIGGATARRRD